jgi:hypothetical protein
MTLNLPIQTVIDRARDLYPIYYGVRQKFDDDETGEHGIKLDQLGGNAGHDPNDPPALRCDHRSPVCVMPPPVLTSFAAVAGAFRR